ncbi:MAG: tetratricopeptide repeat protein [Candidatus Obscuribacterales bacterium]|jgi:tetratricopeptide (TPR) repeat protein
MSDGNRYDPNKDLLRKPEFKIKEGSQSQLSASADAPTDNSTIDGVVPNSGEALDSSVSPVESVPGNALRPVSSSSSSSSFLSDKPFAPAMPIAPNYSRLPYPIVLIIIACGIAATSWWIEPMRGLTVIKIIDMKGAQTPDFLDAHINYADVLYHYGAHNAAVDSLKSALALVAASPKVDKVQQVSLLLRMAMSQYDANLKSDARQTTAQSMAMLNQKTIPSVPISVCWQLNALALTIQKEEDYDRSNRKLTIALWRKAIEYFRDPNPVLVSNFYSYMAYAQMHQGEYAAAAANFMEFVRFSEIRGDRLWRAERYRQAAYCYNSIGEYAKGQAAATKALEMCLRLGPSASRELAYSQYHLGQAESYLGLQQSAIKHLNSSLLELKKYYPEESCYTYALWYLANCYRDLGDRAQAEKFYSKCIKELYSTGSGPNIADLRKDQEKMR